MSPKVTRLDKARRLADGFVDEKAPMDVARRFVASEFTHQDGRTLHHWRGDFYTWQGSYYARREPDATRAAVYSWLESSTKPTKSLVDNVLDALRAVTYLDADPPNWLGQPGIDGDLIACANGLVHVDTRALLPATPRYFNLNAAPFDFDPAADAPAAWQAFHNSLWPDDQDVVATLQELFGLMLTADTSHQKIFLIIGPIRSGKGTIARVLSGLIGRDNRTSPTLAGLGTNFGMASLIGKPLAIISDARLSGRSDLAAVTENLLRISGEDAVSVPRKFQDDWVGQLPTRFMLMTNELPALTDASGALASRFIILPMVRSFFGSEDLALTSRLMDELPGIFNWALDGLDRLRSRGYLLQPASGQAMLDQLDRLASPVRSFVADECVLDAGAEIRCGDLFDAWANWCQAQHRDHPGTLQMLGRNLASAFPQIKPHRPRRSPNRDRFYSGIRLRRGEEMGEPEAPGPRWSATQSRSYCPEGDTYSRERYRSDRGPSRTTLDDLIESAASAAGIPADHLRAHLSPGDLADPTICTLTWLTDYARSLPAVPPFPPEAT